MHIFCTDLDLKRLTDRTHQSRMQRLVHICLRHCDIIFKTSRYRCIHLMDNSKRRITVFYRIYDNTDCKQIIDLIHRLILIHHLLINAEEMLHTSVHFCINVRILHMRGNLIHDLLDKFFPFRFSCIDLLYQIVKNLRLGIFERQVIKLCLDLGNTKPLCDRSIDIHGFFCFFQLLLRSHILQGTHIVQTVGKLDDDNTDIFCHRKEHLTKILSLDLQLIR